MDIKDQPISAHEKSWRQAYDLLKEYISVKGHLPRRSTIYKDVNIGNWVTHQKQAFKAGVLMPQREAPLRSLGIDLGSTRQGWEDALWQKNYELFKEYVALTGQMPPTTPSFIYKGVKLGDWLHRQKTGYNTGKLSPGREARLRASGLDFELSRFDKEEAQWQGNYALLKDYVASTGRFPPQSTVFKQTNLGRWLGTQKDFYKKGKLLLKREALLRSLGVEFKLREEKGSEALEDKIASAEERRDEELL